ncbi:helix-turn-helix domain-containing protein [Methanobrevibacter sp.]|uniref:winged helix-turn-helix transcriptional regulator n=1 Tax=Methanobrevibacter sp. TaxID=66852 RepID=UPI0026DF9626|nr:helix-turn-helix domain-containing protein [Methanobrevibacter sp.]MDO5859184.1 helix-turn-helix domain-containing protein [Methanobrevibacter sp.]
MEATKKLKNFPIDNVIQLIRKKWVIHIIHDLFFGKTRFHEFKEDKPNLSNKVLSNCLKDMEKNGLIHKIVDKYDKKNIRYKLTEKGKSLNKILFEIAMVTVDSGNYSDNTKNELRDVFSDKLL